MLMPKIDNKHNYTYQTPEDNFIVVTELAIPTIYYKIDEETLVELKDPEHLKVIAKARLDYKEGRVLTEEEFLHKLK